jgi:predicted permease
LAGFLLARSLDRRREIAIRLAMGATRRTLIGQLLTETMMLSVLGGVAGVGLSVWLLRILTTADLPLPIPVTLDLRLDGTVLAFSFVISMAAGLLLGIIPALQSTNLEIATTLKDESAGAGTSGRRLSLRNALVIAQVAVALVLMIGAGLFLQSMQNAQRVDPGFGKDPAALMTFAVAANRYTVEEGRIFVRTLLERVEQLPGVQSAGITGNMHLNPLSSSSINFNVDGMQPPTGQKSQNEYSVQVDAGFFGAMGIPIIRGRNFRDSDLPEGQRVAIISEAMAERYWPGQDPIGRSLRRETSPDLLVIGIAADTKIRTLGESPRPFIYRPYSQNYTTFMTLIAKTDLDAEKTAQDVLSAARELDPELWIWEAKTMERHLGVMLLPFRLTALLLTVFAALGMALASIGLYGMVSYAVSQRAREVGIRMSLGADGGTVMRMLIGGGLKLVSLGGVIGLAISFVLTRTLGSLLLEVGTTDPFAFAGSALVLAGVTFFACYLPARRAARVDPMVALRHD